MRTSSRLLLLYRALAYLLLLIFLLQTVYVFASGNPILPASPSPSPAKKIKIALLLDTSNSMDGLIEQAKSQLWTIVEELAKAKCDGQKPEVKIALYEYGNDRLSSREGYIRMVSPFTDDLDKPSGDLFALKTQGGEEYCGYVIQTACRQLDWSTNGDDFQAIFIAGNEPFTQGSVPYKEACALAKNKHIVVNTIFCGPYEEGVGTTWKAGADLAGGSYMSIEQDRKTVFIPSPYDDKITQLNNQLNNTYIEYGQKGKDKKMEQSKQDANAQSYGTENSVKRAVAKSSHIYKNSTWDLVDAAEEKEFDVSKVAKDELPEPMKAMTDAQKKQYIEQKKTEREKIKTEIGKLNQQREQYLAEQKKSGKATEDDKMLDKAMMQSVRKQAAAKKFTF